MSRHEQYTLQYQHFQKGDTLRVEIRDQTRRVIYRNTICLNDKSQMRALLETLEGYSSLNIKELLKDKLEKEDYWKEK